MLLLLLASVLLTVSGQHHGYKPSRPSRPYEAEESYEPSPCALIIPGLGKSAAVDRFNYAKYKSFLADGST